MKLEPTKTGFAVNAADLAQLFELPAEEVHRLMREGGITSRFERGEGADAGRFRLTFFYPRRRVQLVVASDGEVLQHNRISWPLPPRASPNRRRMVDTPTPTRPPVSARPVEMEPCDDAGGEQA